MNRKMILYILGKILLAEAALMLPSVIVGLIYREGVTLVFATPIFLLCAFGITFGFRKPENTTIYAKDGFFIVASSWVLLSLFGAIPFWLCGEFRSFVDCLFEIVSGFTTTGASILASPESLPRCILFWRSFSHWIGGMGVLVFVLAIIPLSDERSLHLMRAEVPGPVVGKLVPRMKDTAKILYGVYTALTLILVGFLLAGKMPLFDALCHAFGTAGTGGFSVRNAGIPAYHSAYIEMVLSVFMLLFGVNFNLYFYLLARKHHEIIRNEEIRWYIGIVIASTAAIMISLVRTYSSIGEIFRYSFFQVSTILTTTGFASADFANNWPQFAQHVLVLLMFIGGCSGSTGGGLKVCRVAILFKSFVQKTYALIHPRAVVSIRMDKKPVGDEIVSGVLTYFSMYFLILVASVLILSADGYDFTINTTAVIACFNNIGPGLSMVGPTGNYEAFSVLSKLVLSLDMLMGRLEIFPILVLFSPSIWMKNVY